MKSGLSVENQIINQLRIEGGFTESLFQLTVVKLGVNYCNGWKAVKRLEEKGIITVERKGRGSPLKISWKFYKKNFPCPESESKDHIAISGDSDK